MLLSQSWQLAGHFPSAPLGHFACWPGFKHGKIVFMRATHWLPSTLLFCSSSRRLVGCFWTIRLEGGNFVNAGSLIASSASSGLILLVSCRWKNNRRMSNNSILVVVRKNSDTTEHVSQQQTRANKSYDDKGFLRELQPGKTMVVE